MKKEKTTKTTKTVDTPNIPKTTKTTKTPKRQFRRRDLAKEYTWSPSEFIDEEYPLTFVFTVLTNSEFAVLNDKLFSTQGDIIYTNQSQVDFETINLKVKRIDNYLQEDNTYTSRADNLALFFETEISYSIISELASYIRTVSQYGDTF